MPPEIDPKETEALPDEPRFSENDLIRMMTRAGQVARGHDLDFARSLGVSGEPQTHMFTTKEDVEKIVAAYFTRVALPNSDETLASDTNYRIRRLFALEEDSRNFKRRTVWGLLTGLGTLILGAIGTYLGVHTK